MIAVLVKILFAVCVSAAAWFTIAREKRDWDRAQPSRVKAPR